MQCDYFLESDRKILSCSAVCFVIQCGLKFLLCGSLMCDHFLEGY